jgi:hypothetical protein
VGTLSYPTGRAMYGRSSNGHVTVFTVVLSGILKLQVIR